VFTLSRDVSPPILQERLAHGLIFYATPPNLSKEKESQLIPVGGIATKDEFEKVKNVTAQEVLTGHRFPVELAAIIPNGGTRGDPIKFNEVYTQNEVIPACEMFMDAVNSDAEVPKHLKFELNLVNGASKQPM
jgi:hypothetical protein